ncbi:unnamed protein product [Schistosoma curassoni]|uniref:Uncharacterized protein n=1 Tax=Schistosoma curassoni TaxID=6186 RepID=A0A183KDX8_9TREM|nr:unnamed protein product [Schistosoma curassoni]
MNRESSKHPSKQRKSDDNECYSILCSFRSSSGGGQDETEAWETLDDLGNSIKNFQNSLPSRYQQTQRIQDSSQQ